MSNGTILMIEDDADIREAVRILLGNENYTIIEAENGIRGLELMTERLFCEYLCSRRDGHERSLVLCTIIQVDHSLPCDGLSGPFVLHNPHGNAFSPGRALPGGLHIDIHIKFHPESPPGSTFLMV